MNATTALLVQACVCAPTAHPAMTAAMTPAVSPNAGAPVAHDAGPYVEFGAVLEQMAGQLQTPEPRHGAEPTVAAESARPNGHGARAIRADAEVDTQPAGDDDDDSDGDGNKDVGSSDSAALRQMTMMPAGPAVTTPIETPMMRRSMRDQTDSRSRATRRAEGAWSGRMEGEAATDKASVRVSTTVRTERPADGGARTAPQVEPKGAQTPARVGRDEPARNGSPKSADMPTTEPGMAPRMQERTVAAMQEREIARPGGRTMVLPDVRGAAGPDESARVAPEALTTAAAEEPIATEQKQLVEAGLIKAQPRDGQGRVSQQPGDRSLASVDAGASQPEDAQVAMDQTNDSTVGQGGHATDGTSAERTPVRESVTVSTKRPVGDTGRTDGHAEPKNMHTSARVGRNELARHGSPRSTSMPITEPGMAPETADAAHGKVVKAETAKAWQAALQPTAPRREGAMTALVESLARHRNLPNPPWEEGLQKAGRREPETNDRPDLAVVVGPTHTMIPAEGPEVSQTSQAARPVLSESAGSSVTRQIAAHVSARAAQGGGEFRARLVPEHLGSVQIRVRVVRGVCTADIRADDAEVARYIESHSSDLKVSLAEHGIDLSGLSVSSRSRAQEGWGAATLSPSQSDWSAPSWNGANARQQYAAAAFAGGNWRDGRGGRHGALMDSGAGMADSHSAVRQSGSPSLDEPFAARRVRGHARIDYLA